MSHPNYGKDFERIIKDSMMRIPGVDVQRLYDTTNGYVGIRQPADYIVYKYPHQYYIECKCTWENTFHKSYLTQLPDLYQKSLVWGITSGVIIWFIKHDRTIFIKAEDLNEHFEHHASVNIKEIVNNQIPYLDLPGKKKRVFFDYDFTDFFSC